MADQPSKITDFVTGFSNEVGLYSRSLRDVADLTCDWPQFVHYYTTDNNILYGEFIPAIPGKAYNKIGWRIWLYEKSDGYRPDMDAFFMFVTGKGSELTDDSWEYHKREVLLGSYNASNNPEFAAMYEVDQPQLEQVLESLNNFIYGKLKPVIGRGKLKIRFSPYASKLGESRRQNRYNPKGLQRDRHGILRDKWGRPMQTDWDEFEKRRGKQANALHNSTHAINKIVEMLEATDWESKIRKFCAYITDTDN